MLADVMDALDEGFHLMPCTKVGPSEDCSIAHNCPVRSGIASVHLRIREILRSVTLAELFHPVVHSDGMQFGLEITPPRRPEPLGV